MEDKEKIKDLFANVLNSLFKMSIKNNISKNDKNYLEVNEYLAQLQMCLFDEWEDQVDIFRKIVRKM